MSAHPPEPQAVSAGPRFGGWPTVGLSALVLCGVVVAQLAGAVLFSLFTVFSVADLFRAEGGLGVADGTDILMALYWLGAVTGIVLMARMAGRCGESLAVYVDLRPVRHLALLPWTLALAAYFALFVVLPERAMAHEGTGAGLHAGGTFLFFVTAVTIAPVFEEMLFRGFIFAGLARSRLGVAGAIVGTKGAKSLIERTGRASFLMFFLAAILFGSGLLMAYVGITQVLKSGLTGFQPICDRAGAAAREGDR